MTGRQLPVVLLIPGIFGFNALGPVDKPVLEYFAGVRKILEPRFTVLVHEPPPTGSLEERAESLYLALCKLKYGVRLPHAAQAVTADRVHLVGHSTGGLDARHVANPKFEWPDRPSPAKRDEVTRMITKIVTIAAPFRGSPVVDHIAWFRSPILGVAYDLTLLGVFRNGSVDAGLLRLIAGAGASVPPFFQVPSRLLVEAARSKVRKELDSKQRDELAAQLQRFLGELHDDTRLYDDLSLEHMAADEAKLAGAESPAPPLLRHRVPEAADTRLRE